MRLNDAIHEDDQDLDPRVARGDEGGYVAPLVALLLIPIIAFTALAVDLGSWYARAAEVERTVGASALAGVVFLPDENRARTEAIAVAKRNGFDLADSNIDVTVNDLGEQRLEVSITDSDTPQYFSTMFRSSVSINRLAVAQYVLPVSMGSPRNFLGTGDDPDNIIPSSLHENFWLAASGPCASRENGDYLLPVSDRNYNQSANPGPVGMGIGWADCTGGNTTDLTGTDPGDTYDPRGYFYGVRVPQGSGSSALNIQAYDASHCQNSQAGDSSATNDNNGRFQTTYTIRGPDPTPAYPYDNPVISTRTFSSADGRCTAASDCGNNGRWRDRWCTLQSVGTPSQGLYFVQVQTSDSNQFSTERHGSNSFSLRAYRGGGFSPCSSDPNETGIYSANCSQVFATQWMGVLANLPGGNPSFFLADIGPEHSNKKMTVTLFDPGEGALSLQLLDPLGNPVNFRWRIGDLSGSDATPTGGFGPASTTLLDVLGNDPQGDFRGWNRQPGPWYGSRSKYSARPVVLEVDLPADIAAAYGGRTWWRVRYGVPVAASANLTDRTTWSVIVNGDPVRLIPPP